MIILRPVLVDSVVTTVGVTRGAAIDGVAYFFLKLTIFLVVALCKQSTDPFLAVVSSPLHHSHLR